MKGPKQVKWCKKLVSVPGVRFCDYEREFAFQIYCADWLRKQFEVTGERIFANWHHSANERSNAREGFLAKMMGQSKGMPDFVQFEFKIAVELKVLGGGLSEAQKEWGRYFHGIGWTYAVVWTFEEFRDLVNGIYTKGSGCT